MLPISNKPTSHKHDHISTFLHLKKDAQPSNPFYDFLNHIIRDKDARKLGILLVINLVCTLLELIYGFISNSIGLISDAAHMLFDSTALAVGIYASYKSKLPPNRKFSYGFERFQTLAGFINGIFLIFIAFYIFIESLERIYNPPVIHTEKMIVVAIIGLLVNVVGVTFFHEHAHFQGIDQEHSCGHHHHNHQISQKQKNNKHDCNDHSHDHNHSHSHSHKSHSLNSLKDTHHSEEKISLVNEHKHNHKHDCHDHKSSGCGHKHSHSHDHDHKHDHKHDHSHDHDHDHHDHSNSHSSGDRSSNENLYGVYLHILADLLGSIGVIASSALIMMFDLYIADAICSAITSVLILASIVPLLKSSSLVFLQTYPVRHEKTFHQILTEISNYPSVVECRDPHLWAFTSDQLVCSVVLVLQQNTTDVEKILKFAKTRFKSIPGVSHVTIDYQFEDY